MQEASDASMNVHHAILVRCLDDIVLSEATSCFDDVLNIGSAGTVDVVPKRNKGIGAESNSREGINPLGTFFLTDAFRTFCEALKHHGFLACAERIPEKVLVYEIGLNYLGELVLEL